MMGITENIGSVQMKTMKTEANEGATLMTYQAKCGKTTVFLRNAKPRKRAKPMTESLY